MKTVKNLFSLKGRLGVVKAISIYLTSYAFYLVMIFLTKTFTDIGFTMFSLFSIILSFMFLWLMITSSVKRMHDSNRSGWWALVPIVSFFMLFLPSYKGETKWG